MEYVEELKITWRTLVTNRDLALANNDWERVSIYSSVIQDMATMIEAAGATLPPLLEVKR